MIKVKKLHQDAKVPVFAHDTDSGADLFVVESLRLKPGQKGIATYHRRSVKRGKMNPLNHKCTP